MYWSLFLGLVGAIEGRPAGRLRLDWRISHSLGLAPLRAVHAQATWALATWLNLPWRPLISIEGTTRFTLNGESNKVVRHVESW